MGEELKRRANERGKNGRGRRRERRACKNLFNDLLPPTFQIMRSRKIKMTSCQLAGKFSNFLHKTISRFTRGTLITTHSFDHTFSIACLRMPSHASLPTQRHRMLNSSLQDTVDFAKRTLHVVEQRCHEFLYLMRWETSNWSCTQEQKV